MRRRGELTDTELNLITQKINDEEALSFFIKDCHLRNLRPATIQYYQSELSVAKNTLHKELVDLQQKDIENLILQSKQQISITTINTRLRALRAFFNFLHKQKHISKNPMKNIKLLRDRQKIIETLDKHEIEALIKTIRRQKTFIAFRDEVILLIFLDTGVRLSELAGIEVQDIQGNRLIIRQTKNLFERTVYLSERTQEKLGIYLKLRGNLETKKLFVNHDNGEFKARGIQARFWKHGQDAKIDKRVSPHTFRHTMAKRMILAGVDAFTLMTILGHSDMTITKKYVNLWGPDIEQKHKEYGALKGLNL